MPKDPTYFLTITGSVSISSGGISFANNATNNTPAAPKRYLAYTSSFSKMHTLQQVYEFLSARLRIRTEEMRLWNLKDEVGVTFLYFDFGIIFVVHSFSSIS